MERKVPVGIRAHAEGSGVGLAGLAPHAVGAAGVLVAVRVRHGQDVDVDVSEELVVPAVGEELVDDELGGRRGDPFTGMDTRIHPNLLLARSGVAQFDYLRRELHSSVEEPFTRGSLYSGRRLIKLLKCRPFWL